jgi:hypothetical protein
VILLILWWRHADEEPAIRLSRSDSNTPRVLGVNTLLLIAVLYFFTFVLHLR